MTLRHFIINYGGVTRVAKDLNGVNTNFKDKINYKISLKDLFIIENKYSFIFNNYNYQKVLTIKIF